MDQRRLRRAAGSRRGKLREVRLDTGCFGKGLEVHLPVGVRGRYIFETHNGWSGLFGIGAAGVATFSVEGDVHLDNAYCTGGKGTVPGRLGDGHSVGWASQSGLCPGRQSACRSHNDTWSPALERDSGGSRDAAILE